MESDENRRWDPEYNGIASISKLLTPLKNEAARRGKLHLSDKVRPRIFAMKPTLEAIKEKAYLTLR